MTRWKMKIGTLIGDRVNLVAEPDTSELNKYVNEAAKALSEQINSIEERMILERVPTPAIERLIQLCHMELAERK